MTNDTDDTQRAPTPASKRRSKRRVRRTRSGHPGVVLLKPNAGSRHGKWRARYRDPDTQRMVKVTLDPLALSTEATRRDWAISKAKSLAHRRMELASGAPRTTGATVPHGMQEYFRTHTHLRPRTLEAYKRTSERLIAWCARVGIGTLDTINRAALVRFRDELIALRRHTPAVRGKRGASVPTADRRGAYTVNKDLRATRTMLGYLRDIDLLPRCSHDEMRLALKRVPAPREQIHYLKPHELQKLLQAALRHDAAMNPAGAAYRHAPIAPFVAGVLLSGMRLGEAHDLEWTQLDMDAPDDQGAAVGEIKLSSVTSKTHRGRTIDLAVSPGLRQLLAALKLRSGATGPVLGLTRHEALNGGDRLVLEHGAPQDFTWQALRRTCATFLTNAPGIFGAASAYRSAKQLGHAVDVAEQSYLGIVRGIPREARTLDAAMQIEHELKLIIAAATQPRPMSPRLLSIRRHREHTAAAAARSAPKAGRQRARR